jgi:hypothetical protein
MKETWNTSKLRFRLISTTEHRAGTCPKVLNTTKWVRIPQKVEKQYPKEVPLSSWLE